MNKHISLCSFFQVLSFLDSVGYWTDFTLMYRMNVFQAYISSVVVAYNVRQILYHIPGRCLKACMLLRYLYYIKSLF